MPATCTVTVSLYLYVTTCTMSQETVFMFEFVMLIHTFHWSTSLPSAENLCHEINSRRLLFLGTESLLLRNNSVPRSDIAQSLGAETSRYRIGGL